MADLTPITRAERAISGEKITPVTRMEYFLQQAASGGGGGGGDITVDGEFIVNSENPVESRVIQTALSGKANTGDIPTKVSDLTNDAGYATAAAVTAQIAAAVGDIVSFEYYLCGVGEYDAQTGVPTVANADTNHIYLVPTAGTNLNMFAYIDNSFVFLGTTEMDLSGYAKTEDLADYALAADIPTVPTNVSAFTNDAGYLTAHQSLSAYAKKSELATVATSGSYNDLSNKPTIPTVPTNVSSFTNDAGYLTQHQSLDNVNAAKVNGYNIVVQSTQPASGTPNTQITIVI